MALPSYDFKLVWGDSELPLGTLRSYELTYSKTVTPTPIPTLPAESAFAIEFGSAINISASFVVKDERITESDELWVVQAAAAVNRWQMRTDGATLIYSPHTTEGREDDIPYIPPFEYQGYIKKLDWTYKGGDNQAIHGNLTFEVGRMHINTTPRYSDMGVPLASSQSECFSIMARSSDGSRAYPLLYYDDEDKGLGGCVSEFDLYGGPEYPFEFIEISMPKKKLMSVAPDLINDLEPGRTELYVRAMSSTLYEDAMTGSKMVITKIEQPSSQTGDYKLTAYCEAEKLKSCTLTMPYSGTPMAIIRDILEGNLSSAEFGVMTPNIVENVDTSTTGYSLQLDFEAGDNVWRVLQICATMMYARIFFANGCVYIIDYGGSSSGGGTWVDKTADIEWSSSDPRIVSVDDKGEITGQAPGSATITGRLGSYSANCTVYVHEM